MCIFSSVPLILAFRLSQSWPHPTFPVLLQMSTKWNDRVETSADNLLSLVHELLGDIIVDHELLDAKHVQYPSSNIEQRQHAQQHDRYREVDVEAVGDEPNHIHVSHYLHKVTARNFKQRMFTTTSMRARANVVHAMTIKSLTTWLGVVPAFTWNSLPANVWLHNIIHSLKLIDRLCATRWTPPDYWQTDNTNGLVMVIRNCQWLNSASRVLISTCSASLVQTEEQFFTVWPWLLTYTPRLAKVKVDPHAKNQDQRSNGSNRKAPTDKRTDTHMNATKCIISPHTWSIKTNV